MLEISYAVCLGLSPAISMQFTLEKCVAALSCKNKFTKTPYFENSRSLEVIDVDAPKKLMASACYDKQHVCAYMPPFLRCCKITFLWGASLSTNHLWGPPSPSSMKFCHKILETLGYHIVETRSLYLTWAWTGTGS